MRSLLDLPEDYIRPEWRTCPVPGRPWWSEKSEASTYLGAYEVGAKFSLNRRDGAFNHDHGYPSKKWDAEKIAAYDAENPLPHPGFRVGQVWALHWLNLTIVVGPLTAADIVQHIGAAPEGAFRVQLVAARFPRLAHLNIIGTALLLDPCRPDLAPWSSK